MIGLLFIVSLYTDTGVVGDFLENQAHKNTDYNYEYDSEREFSDKDIDMILAKIKDKNVNLYYSQGGCLFESGLMHHLTYFHLIDHGIFVSNGLLTTMDCISLDSVAEELKKADYLFLSYPVSEEFNEQFNDYFHTSVEFEENTVYSVEYEGEGSLLKIEEVK